MTKRKKSEQERPLEEVPNNDVVFGWQGHCSTHTAGAEGVHPDTHQWRGVCQRRSSAAFLRCNSGCTVKRPRSAEDSSPSLRIIHRDSWDVPPQRFNLVWSSGSRMSWPLEEKWTVYRNGCVWEPEHADAKFRGTCERDARTEFVR